ncbi:ABC transporter permease [Pseudalkalibacillus sp. SCS-8]|uniref:ABC transporter permease n=1 Tax=Pseudalkalibacillus nanhaiensis TaxID=3115291 RepID=UPI0032DADC78
MRALTLAKQQLNDVFRQPIAWTVLFVMPFALIGFLLYGLEHLVKSDSLLPPFEVAIVDEDDTFGTRVLIQDFQSDDELDQLITFRKVDEEKAQTLLNENKIAAILKVPDGFTNGIKYGDNIPVTVIGNAQRPFQSALFLEMMNSSADYVSAAQSGVNTIYDYMVEQGYSHDYNMKIAKQMINEFTTIALDREEMFIKEDVRSFEGVSPLNYYSVSGLIFLLFLTGLFAMSLTTATNERIEERLRTFGVTTATHVMSALFMLVVILFLQALLVIGVLWILTDVNVSGHIGWSFVTVIAAIVAISIWYTFLSNLPFSKGVRFFVGFVGILLFTTVGSLVFPESYYTGFLDWLNLSTLSHWIHTSLVHSAFIENEDVLLSSLGVIGGMSGLLLFTAFVMRQVKQG